MASCSTALSPTSPTPPLTIPPKGILKNPTVLQQWLSIIQLIFSSYMSHKPDPKKMVIHYITQRNAEDAELIKKAISCDTHHEEGKNLKLGRTLKKEYLGVKTIPQEIIIKEGKTPYIWLEAFLNKTNTSNHCILSFSEQIEYRKKILYLMSDLDVMLLNDVLTNNKQDKQNRRAA